MSKSSSQFAGKGIKGKKNQKCAGKQMFALHKCQHAAQAAFPTRSGKCKRKQINYQPLLYEQASASVSPRNFPHFSCRERAHIEACQGPYIKWLAFVSTRIYRGHFHHLISVIGRNYCPGPSPLAIIRRITFVLVSDSFRLRLPLHVLENPPMPHPQTHTAANERACKVGEIMEILRNT